MTGPESEELPWGEVELVQTITRRDIDEARIEWGRKRRLERADAEDAAAARASGPERQRSLGGDR